MIVDGGGSSSIRRYRHGSGTGVKTISPGLLSLECSNVGLFIVGIMIGFRFDPISSSMAVFEGRLMLLLYEGMPGGDGVRP